MEILYWFIFAFILNVIQKYFFDYMGKFEQHFWLERAQDEKNFDKGDMHDLLIKIRCAFYMPFLACFVFASGLHWWLWLKMFGLILGLAACYPYWHLGSLYKTANKLVPTIYPDGFKSDAGPNSHSKMDTEGIMDEYEERKQWFIIGIIIQVVVCTNIVPFALKNIIPFIFK